LIQAKPSRDTIPLVQSHKQFPFDPFTCVTEKDTVTNEHTSTNNFKIHQQAPENERKKNTLMLLEQQRFPQEI